jgi:outer membrane protein insertion porin family
VKACLLFIALLTGATAFGATTQAVEPGELPQATLSQIAHRKLDRVELLGVTAFAQSDVESSLDIGPGDLVDRGKIERTRENLKTLYKNRGYEQMKISARIYQKKDEYGYPSLTLEYRVSEGEPTRIGVLNLDLTQANPASVRFWNGFRIELEKKIGLAAGDLYDLEKVANAKRVIEEALASNEYIGAKVDDIIVSDLGDASVPDALKAQLVRKKTGRWIGLEFKIILGERATFGFRGNQAIPQSRLVALISEQRAVGFGKDYVQSIRARLEDEYRSQGYAHVDIQAYIFEKPEQRERHITYTIDEGPRVSIEQLQFDGNIVFSSDELKAQFYKTASDVVSHGYYVEKDVQKAAQLLLDWIKSKGYLSAKLLTINHDFPLKPQKSDTGRFVDLSIYLYEGDQTKVRGVELNGLHALTPDEVKSALGVSDGEPLNLFTFSDGIEKLKSLYREKGYLSIQINNEGTDGVVTYHDENRFADVFLDLTEGPQYKVTGIQIEGLVKTKDYVIKRELLFKQGEVLKQSEITGSEAKLHRLGLFSSVSVRALDDPDHIDGKIVRITIQEGTPGVIAGGPGLRNDLGIRLFGQVGYSNLWGENHTISLNVAVNHRFEDFHFVEYATQLAYDWPFFAFGETTFRPTITLTGTEYLDFDAVTASFALNWERKLSKRFTGTFSYALQRIIQFNAQDASDDQGIRIGSVIPSIRYDARDNALNPSSGFFSSLSYEYASPWLLAQRAPYPIGYSRTIFRSDYYLPIGNEVDWYFSFRTGYETNLLQGDTRSSIPLIEQFALGGIGSLRGIQEQALNVRNYSAVNEASYVNYRTQIDLPFAGALKFGPFLDVANLNVDEYSFYKNLLYSPGFSFRYQTPVGPVNLDFGFPINPPPGTDTQEFFFSIGIL